MLRLLAALLPTLLSAMRSAPSRFARRYVHGPCFLVATDGAIAAFGHDRRRLRPNLVIGGVDGMAEREWPGCALRIGKVLIGVQDLRQRCIMTSFDPDTLVQDRNITRSIFQRFGGNLALDCFVIEGGDVALGDAVELLRRAAGEGPASS